MEKFCIPRSVGTHDGTFHADEVTACALLMLFDLIDRNKIVRSRDPEKLASCEYVCDVGGTYDPNLKRFDHHQPEYCGDLSSAGMILLYLKDKKVLDEKLYHFFNDSLILGVDAHDNGRVTIEIGHCSFSGVISNFVPPNHDASAQEVEAAFYDALDFTYGHLKRLLTRFEYIRICKSEVETAMQKKEKYLLFEHSIPWLDIFFELGGEKHPALFLIMPSGEHWKLRGIPPNLKDRMKTRCPLPEKWAGLREKDLEKASGIQGAIFCHKGRFTSFWKTKSAAFEALKKVLDNEKCI